MGSRNFVWLCGITVLFALAGARPVAGQPASCTITTVTNVVFGSYDVFSAGTLDSTGGIRFTCSNLNGASITVDLSKGNAPTYSPRYMLQAAQQLNYNLYLNSTRTSIWGDNTGGSLHYVNASVPDDTAVNVTIYGRIPAGQDAKAGAYTDTISATINF